MDGREKIKIDEDGYLWIERGGKMKIQMCPHDTSDRDSCRTEPCGDWCPLFGEPHFDEDRNYCLSLCDNTEWFTDFDRFEDLREKKEEVSTCNIGI